MQKWLCPCGSMVLVLAATLPAATLKVSADRPDAVYHAGERIAFAIAAPPGATVHYVLSRDGFAVIDSGDVEAADGNATVATLLDVPGIVHCVVTCKTDAATQPQSAMAGAAVDPDKITPSLPAPEDFDAFWAQQKKLLADDPAHPTLTNVPTTRPGVECFDVQINCPGGAPVSGYLAIPAGAKPHSLPAILYTHSAGVRSSDLPHAIKGAKLGLIALDINAHGIPNGHPDKFYEDLTNGRLKSYPAIGSSDRETIYFRGMYLRLMRALDFLTSRPEWDGKTLIVEGSSQGGGQALVAAALDPRVTLCLAAVPALCDHTGFKANRASGWPRIVPKDAKGVYDEKVAQAARYIDAMNFAARIKCPTWVTVGYIDKTCAATSVYAGFNNIPASVEKHIIPRPAMGHAFPADLIAQYDGIIKQHIARP